MTLKRNKDLVKKLLALSAVGLLALSMTGCAPEQFKTFQEAYDTCGSPSGITVSDQGKTIVIDGQGEEDYYGASIGDIACVINAVNTPSYVISNMETTNSLMGRQSATFDKIEVSWSYHPDNGLDIVYHKNDN